MSTKKFTPEEITLLIENPNIVNATPTSLTYSRSFKQKAMDSFHNGMTSTKFFASEGLDPALLGKTRIYAAMKSFKKEAAKPERLREARGNTNAARMAAFAKYDFAQQQTQAALRDLLSKVVQPE